MITHYVEDVGGWEKWQQRYRFGVLLIFPPDPPTSAVNALRSQHDPRSQAACPAHISLTVPVPRPVTDEHWRELETVAGEIPPFTIRYGPLKHYLPHPGVTLDIQPKAALDRLRIAIESASVFSGARPRKHPFSAHMTIAEFISAERTLALMDELKEVAPQGTFLCDGVSYAVPDEAMRFSERKRLFLGRDL